MKTWKRTKGVRKPLWRNTVGRTSVARCRIAWNCRQYRALVFKVGLTSGLLKQTAARPPT